MKPNPYASAKCEEYNAIRFADRNIATMIATNRYKPLSEVRNNRDLPRYVKRVIHFIKYRSLGCLPLSKGRYTVRYSPLESEPPSPEPGPFEVEVPALIPIDTTIIGESDEQKAERIRSERAKAIWSKIAYLRKNEVKDMRLCFIKNGTKTDIQDMSFSELADLVLKNEWYGDVKYCEYNPLPGGVRKKNHNKKKGNRKPKRNGVKAVKSSGGNPRPCRDDEYACYYEFNLTTTAGGTIDLNTCVNSPTQAVNNTGTLDKTVELSRISEGYSVPEYYVHLDQIAPLVQRSGYFIFAYDPDSIPPPTSLSEREIQQFGYRKRCNAGDRMVDFMVKPKKLSAGEYTPLGADPSIAIVREKGIYDWGSPMSNGYVYVKYIGGPVSTSIGKLKIWAFYKIHYPRYIVSTLRDAMYPMIGEPPIPSSTLPDPPEKIEDQGEWTLQDQVEFDRLREKKLASVISTS